MEMDEDEDVEAAERWEGIPKIENMERKMSFGEICVGEWGERCLGGDGG